MVQEEYFWGTLRITNPKTLQRWVDNGDLLKKYQHGWRYNVGCGRFREDKCTCHQCRTKVRPELVDILDKFYVTNNIDKNTLP